MLAGICIALAVIAIAMILISLYGIKLNSQLDDLPKKIAEAVGERGDRWHTRTASQVDTEWPYHEPRKCRGCDWVYRDCVQEARRESGLSTCKENKHKCRVRRGTVKHCNTCKAWCEGHFTV